jgi:tetratricopeptide (TPR) repeat protein
MLYLKNKSGYLATTLFCISICFNLFSQDFLPKLDMVKSLQRDTDNYYFKEIWILSRDINSDDPSGFLTRAKDKAELGYYKEALKDVDKAISLDSAISQSYSLKGFILMKSGAVEAALSAFNKAIMLNDTNIYNYLFSASIHTMLGRIREADSLYRKTLSLDEKFTDGYFGLGNLYFIQGEYKEAETQFNKVLKLDPNFASAYFNIAIIHITNDPDKAIRNLKRAVDVSPGFAQAYFMLGYLEMRQNRLNLTLKDWNKAIALDSLNGLYRIAMGYLKFRNEDYQGGFAEIKKILNKPELKNYVEDFEKSYNDMILSDFLSQSIIFNRYSARLNEEEKKDLMEALGLFSLQKFYLSENIYQKQLKKTSTPGLVHFLRGYNFEYCQQPDLSLNSYISSTREAVFPEEAYLRQGILYNLKGGYKEAIHSLERFIEINDSSKAAYFSLGNSYIGISKYDSAIINFSKILTIDSTETDAYVSRAFCYMKSELYKEAISDYLQITRKRKLDIESMCLLAECKYSSGDTTGAYNLLNKTDKEFHYLSESGFYIRGKINLWHMNYDSAIIDFTEVIKYKSHHEDVFTLRGLAFYCKAEYENSKKDLTEAIRLNEEDLIAFYTLGLVNIKLNKLDEAYSDLKRAESLGHPLARRTLFTYLKDFRPSLPASPK